MYPSGNLQNSSSGERRSSHQHYSMSQVNNEKPIIQREHEEKSEAWGQPQSLSSSRSIYPPNIDSDKNFSQANLLASSSSSLFDRNNGILHDNFGAKDNTSYQQQAYTNQYRGTGQSILPPTNAYRQQQRSNTSSSYSKSSHTTSQQPGIQHFHDVPYYHGFKFQAIPGFFCANEKRIDLIILLDVYIHLTCLFCFSI
jgi:hypothetical protein